MQPKCRLILHPANRCDAPLGTELCGWTIIPALRSVYLFCGHVIWTRIAQSPFSAPVQTGPGAHPASYTMSTGSFPGVKWPGLGVDHPPAYSAEVKERVELYLYSTSGPSWPFLGRNLPLCVSRNSEYCILVSDPVYSRSVFLNAGPRPGTGPWHQLYRAARGSPGICHFSFLSNFHE